MMAPLTFDLSHIWMVTGHAWCGAKPVCEAAIHSLCGEALSVRKKMFSGLRDAAWTIYSKCGMLGGGAG